MLFLRIEALGSFLLLGGVLIGLFLPIKASGQVLEVKDEDGNPVPAAIVRNKTGTARMTDLEGRLHLDSLIRQGDTLEIRSLGFGTRSVAMPEAYLDMEVKLAAASVNLSEVVVAAAVPTRPVVPDAATTGVSAWRLRCERTAGGVRTSTA